jgi:hypothetical protein
MAVAGMLLTGCQFGDESVGQLAENLKMFIEDSARQVLAAYLF